MTSWPGTGVPVDGQAVVALAEEQVEHVDRSSRPVVCEYCPVTGSRPCRRPRDAAEERVGSPKAVCENVAGRRPCRTRSGRGGHHARRVGLAAVVEDVQRVDLLGLRRLHADAEQRAVLLERQHHGGRERLVAGPRAADDLERAADAGEQVRRLREADDAQRARRDRVVRVGDDRHGDREPPVGRVEGARPRPTW